jgi:hypothetical protein
MPEAAVLLKAEIQLVETEVDDNTERLAGRFDGLALELWPPRRSSHTALNRLECSRSELVLTAHRSSVV